MTSRLEFLQGAINTIKLSEARKGLIIIDEDIARKAGFSVEQFQSFLKGKRQAPDNLDIQLLSLYGIKRRIIEFIDPLPPDMLQDSDDEEEE
ncbi:MAG TPA: hypothetical protein VG890_11350 [Puia sp.]|nr:hypothetical protein [Puia sp.]